MLESEFKGKFLDDLESRLIKDIGYLFYIHTNGFQRSFPDLIILGKGAWAALEFKASVRSSHQPNQDFYIEELKRLGYATFVYPENAEEVLNELEELFTS